MSEEPKQSGGCLVRGCLFFSVVLFVFVGFFFWGAYSTYKNLYALTSDKPVAVPVYQGGDATEAKQRVDRFVQDLDAGKAATLTLSADDLNALVAYDGGFAAMKNRIFFAMEGSALSAQVSAPLDGVRGMQGRWLNATVVFEPKIENRMLSLIPKSIKAGGLEAPSPVLMALQAFPWSNILVPNPNAEEAFSKMKSLRVENGRLVIESVGN